MTAGADVACSEENCVVAGVNAVGAVAVATVDCNVGGNGGNGNSVFVNGSVEVSDGEVEQLKKEGLGLEKEGVTVDQLVSVSNVGGNGRMEVSVGDVENGSIVDPPVVMVTNGCLDEVSGEQEAYVKKGIEVDDTGSGLTAVDDVNLKNGSIVDPHVVMVSNGTCQDVNGCLEEVSGEREVDVKSGEEVGDVKMDDTGCRLTDSTLNSVKSSQVTVLELEMTVGADVVCSEEKCVSGANAVAAIAVATVGCNVGGNGNGGVEGVPVDPLVSETNGGVNGCMMVSVGEVKAVKDDVDVENGSAVDTPVVLVSNGCLDEVSGEQEVYVKSTEEVYGSIVDPPVVLVTNGIAQDVNGHLEKVSGEGEEDVKIAEDVDDAKMDDTVGHTGSTLNTVESSQVTVSAVKPSDVAVTPDVINGTDESLSAPMAIGNTDIGVTVNDGPESTVDGSGKISEDLEFQVTADRSDSSGSAINDWKGQATDDVSGKPYEDLGSQVTADEPDSCGSPVNEQECKVSVDGSDSVGSLVDNQECPVSVDETEPSAKHTEKVESNTTVVELDGKSEEHQEVNVEVEPNHVCSMIKAEIKNPEGTEIRSGIVTEENPDSGLVLPEEVDALANGQVEKFDRILEMGETQISGTEADGSSEKLLEVTESVETEVNTEAMKEYVKVDVPDELNLEDNTAKSANEPEVSLEAETNAETVKTTNTMEIECNSCELLVEKDNGSLSNPDDLIVVEQKVETESHLGTDNRSAEGIDCGIGIEKETEVKDAEDVPHLVTEFTSPERMDCGTPVENVVSDDEEKESEVKDAHVELIHHIVIENVSAEDMDCETGIKNVNFPDEVRGSEVNDASLGDQSTSTFSNSIVNHGAVIEFGSIGRHETTPIVQNEEVEDMNGIQTDEIPDNSVEGEVNDAIDVQNEEVEVLEYNFLVRIPRFEDENLRDQIRSAQEVVEEKTGIRDSYRAKVLEKRDMLKAYNVEYDLVKKDEIAARRVVRAKRQEIEAVQAIISRWKNAMSVEEIDARIFGVEYLIQHETIRLVDEKAFIREIKQLKSLRDELASNMGTPEEIRHAIDTKDQNEERMKTLRKELESLKREVSKVEAVLETIAIKYEAISNEEKELQRRFRAADAERQKAYAHLNSLKKLLYDKNKNFRQFKEDLTAAKTSLSKGDKDALHRLCANQVETFMEQWNNNDKFRQEYVSRCIMNACRKQKALDGAPLVPDEVAPVLPGNVNGKVDRSPVSIPGEVEHVSVVLPVEQGKDVSSVESKSIDIYDTSKSIEKVSGQKEQELKNKGDAKPTNLGSGDVTKEAELAEVTKLAENIPTKEEIELARKAEELRKEEIAAKLKEQRRLEEKAKAIEALERKKRNAEKAQLRADLRARKEAEQKEKEREKRLRKKEKKACGGDGCNGEEVYGSEGSNEAATKEIETVANKKKSQKPPAHFFSKQLKPKPVPPPLINKNKRRWQQLGRVALAVLGVLGVLCVFLLANFGLFVDFKSNRFTVAI